MKTPIKPKMPRVKNPAKTEQVEMVLARHYSSKKLVLIDGNSMMLCRDFRPSRSRANAIDADRQTQASKICLAHCFDNISFSVKEFKAVVAAANVPDDAEMCSDARSAIGSEYYFDSVQVINWKREVSTGTPAEQAAYRAAKSEHDKVMTAYNQELKKFEVYKAEQALIKARQAAGLKA